MSSCKRRVWVTMCEQADGSRTGKYAGFRYSSVPKDDAKPVKKKAATAKAKPVKKTGTTPKKTATKTATKVAVAKTTTKTDKPIETFAAAIFKKLGKDISTEYEMVMAMSLDWRWMNPKEAKSLVKMLIKKGAITLKGDFVRPSKATSNTTVPTGYKPNVGALLKEV